jgi:hypothetical protein
MISLVCFWAKGKSSGNLKGLFSLPKSVLRANIQRAKVKPVLKNYFYESVTYGKVLEL